MATKTQLLGGAFQDSEGNPLSFGYLTMKLSQDASVSGVGNICSGLEITIQLDVNGNVVASPAQSVWANTDGVLSPINTYYRVTGYTAAGQRAWGPNNQQVGSGASFNLDTWVPNTVISWFPTVAQPLTLEINSAPASSQSLQNLEDSATVTIVDNGGGNISFTAESSSSFDVDGTPISSTNPINFESGSGISVTNPSAGNILITNTFPAGSFDGNGAYFFGPGITSYEDIFAATWGEVNCSSINGSTIPLNTVVVVLFELYTQFTISKCSQQADNNSNGGTTGFAIYSQSGNFLVDGGSFDQLTGLNVQTHTFTPVTLPPGLYWLAYSVVGTDGAGADWIGIKLSSNGNNPITLLTTNQTRFATAANPSTDGPNDEHGNPTVLWPATLGDLTPWVPTSFGTDGIVCPLWE